MLILYISLFLVGERFCNGEICTKPTDKYVLYHVFKLKRTTRWRALPYCIYVSYLNHDLIQHICQKRLNYYRKHRQSYDFTLFSCFVYIYYSSMYADKVIWAYCHELRSRASICCYVNVLVVSYVLSSLILLFFSKMCIYLCGRFCFVLLTHKYIIYSLCCGS